MNEPSPKFAVLGDVHANLEALLAVLADARQRECTHFACAGDLVGYNANPTECLNIIRELGIPCVKGNHDDYASADDAFEILNPRAALAIRWTRQQLSDSDKTWLRELKYVRDIAGFSIVHASLDAPHRWNYVFDRLTAASSFTYQHTAVCFYGHTHLPVVFTQRDGVSSEVCRRITLQPGCKYMVNVGSVGEPRDGTSAASYVTYSRAERAIEFHRVAYDSDLTESKVREAGLPSRRKQ